ncbi:dihydrolipoyl dehydrogenase [Acinetobacter nectaris]|uniref:dihydrolipoyl dehydrogenase n=1 Tax=Acinetobacter nectaris TaxID=1219382 RepID=UPI001F2FEF92|nr:dihydrolipoyl dehydrogenase [Acinetobacter nectaris]MCF9047314.1 dihydrolipoyl dehydrogenase [Acinetobacter nectaris]
MVYDIIIIGAGTAGISAYKEAIKHTNNILIINQGPWDTTCARVGCMPSKLLISSANQLHDAKTLDKVGIQSSIYIDTSKVMQRVRKYRDQFTASVMKDVNSWEKSHKINGKASFINTTTIEVNGKQYTSKSFIIAVGSIPRENKVWEDDLGDLLLTSDTIFELSSLPKSIAIIGSGAIATELAQALYNLDVKVHIFTRSKHIAIATSPKIQMLIQDELSQKLNVFFETIPTLKKINNQISISYLDNSNKEQKLCVDYVLNATGRTSLLETLQINNIDPNFHTIENLPIAKDTKQLANLPIFVIGDAYTNTPVQHEASYEGKVAVKNCLSYPNITAKKNYPPLSIVFSSPEIAIVGQSYQQLKEAKQEFTVGFASYANQGRATVLGKNIGGIEIYIDNETHKFLGSEIYVTQGEHLAHLLAWSLAENITLEQLLSRPFYHPTLEEGLRTALRDAMHQLHKK